MNLDKRIKIYALGDISFAGHDHIKPSIEVFRQTASIWADSDFVIGNLESPLLNNGRAVPNKCVLRASPQWVKVLNSAGINLVSLANNHIMDFGPDGLFSTIEALKKIGISFLGAGINLDSACSPCYVTLKKQRIAFLARTSVMVASPCYASQKTPGVAYLDINETKATIKECKRYADTVALIVHWGVEHYSYPTPSQRQLAQELVEAGANLIIGHHPHVLQGTEKIGNGIVCYSLGNFFFNDIKWSFIDQDNKKQNRTVKLNHANRQGGVLGVDLTKGSFDYDFIPTVIRQDGSVDIHVPPERKKIYNRLSARLQIPCYNIFWKIYAFGREWNLHIKPMIQGKITWEKIRKIRFKHFQDLFHKIKKSVKITSEKSTNPYD